MPLITANNIVAGKLVHNMLQPHQFQTTITYRLVADGKTEDVVRKRKPINCCKKIGTKHNYTKYHHPSTAPQNIRAEIKPLLAKHENIERNHAKGKILYALFSRTLVPPPQPLPPPAPQVTAQQMQAMLNVLQQQINRLNATVARLAVQLALATADKQQLKQQLTAVRAELTVTKAQLDKNNLLLAANQQALATTQAQARVTEQLLNQLLGLV